MEFGGHHLLGWPSLLLALRNFFYNLIDNILYDFITVLFCAYNLEFWSFCEVSKFYHVLITYNFLPTFTLLFFLCFVFQLLPYVFHMVQSAG